MAVISTQYQLHVRDKRRFLYPTSSHRCVAASLTHSPTTGGAGISTCSVSATCMTGTMHRQRQRPAGLQAALPCSKAQDPSVHLASSHTRSALSIAYY
eukprot:3941812-Rhodomonas_salina.10